MTISKKTLEFTLGIDSRESGTTNLWSKMRTKDYDPHGGHVIMAVQPFWDEDLMQWLPCWWCGPWRSCSYHNVGVALLVYLSYKWPQWKRYDGLHSPKKKQTNACIENNIPELQRLQRKIWQFWRSSVERCDHFSLPPWSTRSRPPRSFVEVS